MSLVEKCHYLLNFQNEEVDDKASQVLPSGLMDQLADPKWKERLDACEKFKQVLCNVPLCVASEF